MNEKLNSTQETMSANTADSISPMAVTSIVNGSTYTFKNVGTGRMLNLWGGVTTNATNVCQYSADGSNEQKWTRRGSKLYTNTSTSKCLDRYVGGGGMYNNADIYDDNDDENQNLEFISSGGYVAIRLAGTNYYLTASSNAGSDSLMNSSGNSSSYKAPDAAGNVFWKYVSSSSSLNGYSRWEANETGVNPYAALNWRYVFSSTANSSGNYGYDPNGLYNVGNHPHVGIDVICSEGTPLYCPASATVYAVGGAVSQNPNTPNASIEGTDPHNSMGHFVTLKMNQKDPVSGKTMYVRYLHMKSVPPVRYGQTVSAGTLLGYVGNTGRSSEAHLHLDINTTAANQWINTGFNLSNTINPVNFFPNVSFPAHYYKVGTNF